MRTTLLIALMMAGCPSPSTPSTTEPAKAPAAATPAPTPVATPVATPAASSPKPSATPLKLKVPQLRKPGELADQVHKAREQQVLEGGEKAP